MIEMMLSGTAAKSEGKQKLFDKSGTFTWIVPSGVTSICAVIVATGYLGGGGLSWLNNIPVTPGESLTISQSLTQDTAFIQRTTEKLLVANRGTTPNGGLGGPAVNPAYGGGNGGQGGNLFGTVYFGGGAGGYSGKGGNAYYYNPTQVSATNGAGGGGGGGTSGAGGYAGKGGGTALTGEGGNGMAGTLNGATNLPDGTQGSSLESGTRTTSYGGGAGRTNEVLFNGGIRIIWGDGRQFPSTRTQDEF